MKYHLSSRVKSRNRTPSNTMLPNLKLQHLMLDSHILGEHSVELSLVNFVGSQQLLRLVQLPQESSPLFLHVRAVLYKFTKALGRVEGKAATLPLVEMDILMVGCMAMVVVGMLVWRGGVGVAWVGRFGVGVRFGIGRARCVGHLGT